MTKKLLSAATPIGLEFFRKGVKLLTMILMSGTILLSGANAAAIPSDNLQAITVTGAVSSTHLRAHETVLDLVCRLLLEKKNTRPLIMSDARGPQ